MGEGGAVYTKNPLLHKIVRSFRDWGRDCVCAPGQDNLCGHRFDRQYGELPLGYDHKYVYSHFGYNLKATDMQAAVGCAQLRKFPSFVERRIHNFNYLKEALKGTEDKLILPEACENSEPSWFGFLITCREGVDRNQLVQKIEEKGVQTRMLFAGNLIKHPCFDQMRATGRGYRVAGSLENTDRIMTDTFWIGVYPGMTDAMLDAMADAIKEALEYIVNLSAPHLEFRNGSHYADRVLHRIPNELTASPLAITERKKYDTGRKTEMVWFLAAGQSERKTDKNIL